MLVTLQPSCPEDASLSLSLRPLGPALVVEGFRKMEVDPIHSAPPPLTAAAGATWYTVQASGSQGRNTSERLGRRGWGRGGGGRAPYILSRRVGPVTTLLNVVQQTRHVVCDLRAAENFLPH